MATPYDKIYEDLEYRVNALEQKFVAPHQSNLLATPDSYDLDVRAFCVLAHAAFEEFVEDTCLTLMQKAISAWELNHCISQPLLGLIAFQNDAIPTERDESKPEASFFEHIRRAASDIKAKFSIYLKVDNHGVSTKYLRPMLLSVGLDVPTEVKWLGSLGQLAKQRGDIAHHGQARSVPAPADAIQWVKDCLELCAHIRSDAKAALFRPSFVHNSQDPIDFAI